MKKKLFTLVILLISAVGCFAQDSLSNSWGDIRLSAGLAMGRDFCGTGFYSDNVSIDYSKRLNPKANIRLGASVGEISSGLLNDCEDKAPYSKAHRRTSAYAGFDYDINPNLFVSVTAFFDNVNLGGFNHRLGTSQLQTNAVNASMTYKFKDNGFLRLSFTYLESNNPLIYHYPCSPYGMPLGCYDIVPSHFGFGGYWD